MTQIRVVPVCGLLAMAALLGGCAEKARSCIDIDPRADEALHKMSAALSGARSFSFRSVTTMEQPIATGQLAQFTRQVQVAVRRPDEIIAESHQGEDVFTVCYRGTNLTVLDKTANTYACAQVPDRIDPMLDDVAQKYGLTLPLADLLFSDPYKVLTADARTGRYVGLHEVDGVKCHHLLFTQEVIDWQIWVDAAKEAVPRKFLIDYKTLPERPQFTAAFSDWDLSAKAGEEQFMPVLPAGAKKVEMTQLFEAAEKGE